MIEIHIFGANSKLLGDYPVDAVREVTSYYVAGYQHTKAYKKRVWDGRKHLLNKRTGSFPTGLLSSVQTAIEGQGLQVEIIDHRDIPTPTQAGFDLHGVSFSYPYDYQLDACKTMVEKKQGIVKIATNGGKCLGLGTKVRLFDGSVKLVEDIIVGDQLMGPDNRSRLVLSTTRGYGPLYKINQKRGESYICNDAHVLTLQDCRKKNNNKIVDIEIGDYLKKDNYFKHCFKHFSVGIEYPRKDVPIDPYFIGLWLGDGSKTFKGPSLDKVAITTKDQEIVDYLKLFADTWDLDLREDPLPNNSSSTYYIIRRGNKHLNSLKRKLSEMMSTSVGIPEAYLINSREVRLSLLAGLIDSDGHRKECKNNSYEITFKNKELIDSVYLLCRSLGFGVSPPKKKLVKWKDGRLLEYWRLHFHLYNADIPTLLRYKRPNADTTRTSYPCTRFTVERVGEGEYAGFTLDEDGRFLLEDYTVTHNTEVSCAVTQYLGLSTLFIVSTLELMYQGRERFKKRLGLTDKEIGIVGDGEWEPGTLATIAMLPTLESRMDTQECQKLLKSIDVLFLDECHHTGAETWFTVATLCPAYYRFGLSGTPLDRTDGANLKLIAAIGEPIVDIPNKVLVERGVSAGAEIIFDKVTEPILSKGSRYPTAYKQGVVENPQLLSKIIEWTKIFYSNGLGVLILCEEIIHGKMIDEALWTDTGGQFIPHQFIYGEEDTEVRQTALKNFAEGKLPVLIASRILDEGVDVPTIDALITAGSRKSRIKTMQRLGRGLRGKKLIVIEFINFCHRYLLEHSNERLEDYKKEDCFPVHFSEPNENLVKRIWNAQNK